MLFRSQDPDPTAPERLAHTLKGTAGTVGATGVCAAAAALEIACRSQQGDKLALLDTVLFHLQQVLPSIHAMPAEVDDASPGLMDKVKLQEYMSQLGELILSNDAEAICVADKCAPHVHGEEMKAPFRRMRQALSEFDFDRGAEHLVELTQAVAQADGSR